MADNGMWEGYGGPVQYERDMNVLSSHGIDPTLDTCCQREIISNRKRNNVEATLRRHDVTLLAERRRKHLVSGTNMDWQGCRCCYDPNSDGGEYRALIEARSKQQKLKEEQKFDDDEANSDDDERKGTADNINGSDQDDSDSDLDEFDYLLDEDLPGSGTGDNDAGGAYDDDDENRMVLKQIENRRRMELELQLLQNESAQQHGYGVHRQMHPSRVLKVAGLRSGSENSSYMNNTLSPPGVVLHLVDPDSTISGTLDLFLEQDLAPKYRGTKFIRSGGRSTLLMDADFASKVLPSTISCDEMPCLVAIRDGCVVASTQLKGHHGLTCFNDDNEEVIEKDSLENWLDHAGVLVREIPEIDDVCRIRPEELALFDYLGQEASQKQENTKPKEERYDCGNPNCSKAFPHEHVGVKNDQQNGLLVGEEFLCGAIESNTSN